MKRLKRTRQCDHCPWRKDVDPFDIPDGYSVEKHKALEKTIAKPGQFFDSPSRAMSCHEHSSEEEVFCVGWLFNQLGVGNNIGLRLQMMKCENSGDIEVIGEQHRHFLETLPESCSGG
jgi:hypothetical protein